MLSRRAATCCRCTCTGADVSVPMRVACGFNITSQRWSSAQRVASHKPACSGRCIQSASELAATSKQAVLLRRLRLYEQHGMRTSMLRRSASDETSCCAACSRLIVALSLSWHHSTSRHKWRTHLLPGGGASDCGVARASRRSCQQTNSERGNAHYQRCPHQPPPVKAHIFPCTVSLCECSLQVYCASTCHVLPSGLAAPPAAPAAQHGPPPSARLRWPVWL